MRKPIKIAIIVLPLATILSVLTFYGIKILNTVSPEESMKQARIGISNATECLAHILEPKLFQKAEDLYFDAKIAWERENEKPIYKRNYDHIIAMAHKSVRYSTEACAIAKNKAANEKSNVKQLYAFLKNKRDKFQEATTILPLTKNKVKDFHTADLLLREAANMLDDGDFIKARKKLEQASTLMSNTIAATHAYLKDYYDNYPMWASDVQEAIRSSRQGTVLLIDKIAHECEVYKNGSIIKKYDVDLGKKWIGQKMREGDYATPEGSYRITEKKAGRTTIYYKALLLDYPNREDYQRVSRLNHGKRPRLGGMIEIHGEGGKNVDWTKGCIALSNSDIDEIYRLVDVGTRVFIVGSKQPFSEIEKEYFD
jgi:L,D-peptidoglycan transpeptidase YkuD (ErfK/YbiS/YcfS/YnhG family)